eukprot:13144406-Ditylum_brightwellii.AAC.1
MSHLSHTDGTQPDNEYESQFVWDYNAQEPVKDVDDKSPPKNEDDTGGKQKADAKGSLTKKQIKKAVELKTQEDAPLKSIKAQLKDQGETALKAEAGYQTDTKFEWVLNKDCSTFNIRTTVIALLNKIVQVDPSLSVQSRDDTTAWKTPAEIPTGAAFTTAFAIKQETLLKGPTHVKAYATLFSKLHLNTIKFENKVYFYI